MSRRTALFVSLLLPSLAFAHGHVGNGFGERLLHILTSIDHLWVVAMLVIAGVFVRRIQLRLHCYRTRASRQDRSPNT